MLTILEPPPKGFVWKPLDTFPHEETPPPEPSHKKLFQELALEKIKGPANKAPAPR